jgi:hypothetical protein
MEDESMPKNLISSLNSSLYIRAIVVGKCIAKKATINTETKAIIESGFDLRCERPALIVPAFDSKSVSLTFSTGFLKNQIMIEEKRNRKETINMTV